MDVVSSSRLGIRYFDNGFLFDVGGSSMFMNQNKLKYSLAFLASKIAFEYLEFLNPTLNFQPGNLSDLPVIFHNGHQLSIEQIVVQNIAFAKADWDSFETSWDFQRHPLLVHKDGGSLEQAFNNWSAFTEEQFQQLKANEDLNRIFIESMVLKMN